MDTKTHIYITTTALKILDDKSLNELKDGIIHYSTQPDFDENESGYKGHFYNPSTGKNFVDGYDSALSRFYTHYENAIQNKKNNLDGSTSLGRAIHYLEDLCTPVHTYNQDIFDAAVNISSHVFFENRCNDLVEDIKDEELPTGINVDYFTENALKTIGINASLVSSVLFHKYSKIKHKSDVDGLAIQSIMNGIKNTYGILYRYSLSMGTTTSAGGI